jgi:hypothetical protein
MDYQDAAYAKFYLDRLTCSQRRFAPGVARPYAMCKSSRALMLG